MKKRILVVVDMQNDFTTGALGNERCAAAIPEVTAIVKGGGYDVIAATRDTHHEDYLETREGRNLPVVHCIEGTEGWQIVPEIEAAIRETAGESALYFDKPTFGSVKLAEYLRSVYETVEQLEIDFVGVCTGICVISNVMLAKAYCPEAEIRVLQTGCACVTPDTHSTALDAMRTCQVVVE